MRKDRVFCLAAITLPLVLGGCADSLDGVRAVYGGELWGAEESVATPYDLGKRHYADGRYGLAVHQFEIAAAKDPGSVEAINGLAAAYDRLQRFDQAERLYLRALTLDPDSVQTLNNLGYSYLMRGNYRLAMTYLSDAYALDSTNTMIAHNYQRSRAAMNLETRDFVASSIQAEKDTQLARAPDTPTADDAAPVPAETETQPVGVETEPVVRIVTLGGGLGTWVERTSAAVQTLITRPHPEVYLAVSDAGVAPALANYRRKSALDALEVQPAPWQGTRAAALSAAVLPAAVLSAADLSVAAEPLGVTASVAESSGDPMSVTIANGDSDAMPGEETLVTVARPHDVTTAAEISVAELSVAETSGAETSGAETSGAEAPETYMPGTYVPAAYIPVAYGPVDEEPLAPPSSEEAPLVEISNGTGRLRMALRVGGFLEDAGFDVGRLTNAEHFRHQQTIVYYRDSWLEQARWITAALPAGAKLEAAPDQGVDIRIRLGGDLLNFDRELFYADRKPSSTPTG